MFSRENLNDLQPIENSSARTINNWHQENVFLPISNNSGMRVGFFIAEVDFTLDVLNKKSNWKRSWKTEGF